jgi:hypothetical protein
VTSRDNDIDVEPNELGRDLGVALDAALRPAVLDRDGAVLDPTEFAQARHKSSRPWTKGRSVRTQEPDSPQLARLLRTRNERPCCCRAAECRDEIAATHPSLPRTR